MLDVRRMQVLRAVVSSGSVSAAALNLGYTPSAISQQLAALEREAGTALLEKAGRKLRPTPAGILLAERAGEVTELLNDTEQELADIRSGCSGTVRLRFFHTAAVGLIPAATTKFRAALPEVRLELRIAADGLLDAVGKNEADVAVIVVGRAIAEPRGVRLVHLVDDPYRIVLPKDHPMAEQEHVDLAALAEESWVDSALSTEGSCRESLLDAYACAGFSPKVALEVDNSYAAQGFVAAGIGIALVPRLGLEAVHPDVVIRPIRRPEPVRHLYVAVREAIADTVPTTTLINALTESATA